MPFTKKPVGRYKVLGGMISYKGIQAKLKGVIASKTSCVLSRLPKILKLATLGISLDAFQADVALHWYRVMWHERLWKRIYWFGIQISQWPTDLQLIQELVYTLKPRFIVETGTGAGGSAIFFASLFKLFDIEGQVISVDNNLTKERKQTIENHPLGKNIILLKGNSISTEIIHRIKQIVGNEKEILVFLDSCHSYDHVLNELRLYQQFVPVGGYICAFDTIIKYLHDLPSGKPQWKNDNPHHAVMDFLKENNCFVIDKYMNRLLVGCAPDGFLKRIK